MGLLKLLNTVPFSPFVLALALIADLVMGDPERAPHPVRWIGRLIAFLEGLARRLASGPAALRCAGVFIAVITVGLVYFSCLGILYIAHGISNAVFIIVSVFFVWASLSIKSLMKEAASVISAIEEDGLDAGRKRLSRIVGRDTASLTKEGVLKAVVETVSENTCDGVVAPLLYLAIGGPVMMMAYKAVNTLDSMVGHKNEKYLHLGWFSARLDDAANFLPARLSAALIVTASFVLGYNWRGSLRVALRDGRNHPSPNSGVPEAAAAGALGLRLGGPMSYCGVLHEKPYIGGAEGAQDAVDAKSVRRSIRLLITASLLMAGLVFAARSLMILILRA